MRVALYCRVASRDGFNLETQAATLQQYARRAGYTIVGAWSEQASGMTLSRPALKKVTEAVLTGKVDMVIVKDLSRIGRDWGMTQDYINLLTKNKVKLLCIVSVKTVSGLK